MPNEPTAGEPQAGDPTTNPQPQAGTSGSQADKSSNPDIDALQQQIAELRRENAAHRRKTKEQEEATAEAERKRLAEQGQYKELAEQHQAKVKELEPVAESYQKLADLVHEQIKTAIKEWPDEIKALVPGKDTPVEQRLEQVEKLRPLVDKFATNARAALPGNRPGPKPTGSVNEVNADAIKTELLRSDMYKAF